MAALAPPTTSSKPPLPPRLALPLALALLLALAFVADFLSYSSAISPAVSPSSKTVKEGSTKLRNGSQPVRHLNATFSDLPAPHWEWEEMPPAPVPRLDGASVQIGDLFYVVAGYESLDHRVGCHT
ncbi:kelch repeat-containing protein At3g27220-like isoform X2 [Hordeum vulgare subsp. vulgare]|uniref:kelch repeat-containing protein At3g27220-like isoform X2 n=1 Tax=Hordeum vulgare subsp. vulgare TaxID=112509 RepID=UPI000B4673AB|nr:kelch repeat-containing protein At3g27220-like isoform X2 [Hordeum vulgare subsp. vulgare]XP_044959334.1 kelch repeat-containing protein At3g27220-like isoform X2 [Hordeum vulgare subsp. vulgare]